MLLDPHGSYHSFQIIVHLALSYVSNSLTLIKFSEQYINIYKFKSMHYHDKFYGEFNETYLNCTL